jgi:hypothetical protein
VETHQYSVPNITSCLYLASEALTPSRLVRELKKDSTCLSSPPPPSALLNVTVRVVPDLHQIFKQTLRQAH